MQGYLKLKAYSEFDARRRADGFNSTLGSHCNITGCAAGRGADVEADVHKIIIISGRNSFQSSRRCSGIIPA